LIVIFFSFIFPDSAFIIYFYNLACTYSNCLNGGICQSVDKHNYKCNCSAGFFGINCQSQYLNSSIFLNSTILSQDLSVQLEQLIQFPNETKFSLIYQATNDGFGLKDFYSKCNNISNTLIIIQTIYPGFIMGGFTTKVWPQTTTDTFTYDMNAFIFSLINPLNQAFKMNINKPDSATYTGADHILSIMNKNIGFGQSDLLLNDYSNVNINFAWASNALSYNLDASLAGNGSLLISGKYFLTAQVEVFVVDACWSSPCLNGGACSTVNFKYVCSCINSFTGDLCNVKLLNSIIFKNSNILTQEQSVSLLQVISPFPNIGFNLIYQASRDGFGINDFHSKCDGILNTLMIIKTTDSYVFGGYTTQDWTSLYDYKPDSNAFLFSLINSLNMTSKMNIIEPNYAIYQGPNLAEYDFNDFIGFGENEILLNDNSNYQTSYAWSSSSSATTFLLPEYLNNNGSILNGGKSSFLSAEIEVFSLGIFLICYFF
jgi:hypothetical protein